MGLVNVFLVNINCTQYLACDNVILDIKRNRIMTSIYCHSIYIYVGLCSKLTVCSAPGRHTLLSRSAQFLVCAHFSI